MSGYRTPDGDGLGPLIRKLEEFSRRLSELEVPTGTSQNSLVAQVQEAIAAIGTTINAWLLANSYTKAQIDNLVANPGNIAPGNVSASGRGTFNVGVTSVGAYDELLSGSGGTIRALWIHPDGRVGYLPSDEALKLGMKPAQFTIEQVLELRAVFFRYQALVPYTQEIQPEYLGAMAQEVADAGFPWLVDRNSDGRAVGVHHTFGWLVVLEGIRDMHQRDFARDRRIARIEESLGLDPID